VVLVDSKSFHQELDLPSRSFPARLSTISICNTFSFIAEWVVFHISRISSMRLVPFGLHSHLHLFLPEFVVGLMLSRTPYGLGVHSVFQR